MKRLDMDVFHSEKEYYEAMFLCVRGFAEHYIRTSVEAAENGLLKRNGGVPVYREEVFSLLKDNDGDDEDLNTWRNRFLAFRECGRRSLRSGSIIAPEYLFYIFGLDDFESFLVLNALVCERDHNMGLLHASLTEKIIGRMPTFSLCIRLYSGQASERQRLQQQCVEQWEKLALLFAGLDDIYGVPTTQILEGYFESELKLDYRIMAFLQDMDSIDGALEGIVQYGTAKTAGKELLIHQKAAECLDRIYVRDQDHMAVFLHGEFGAGKKFQAEKFCEKHGRQILFADSSRLPEAPETLRKILKRIMREAILQGNAAVCVYDLEKDREEDKVDHKLTEKVLWGLQSWNGMLFLTSRYRWNLRIQEGSRRIWKISLPETTTEERIVLWKTWLREEEIPEGMDVEFFADKYILSAGCIRTCVDEYRSRLWLEESGPQERWLMEACRSQLDHRLGNDAVRIRAQYTWDDLVLPEPQKKMLKDACDQVIYHHQVYHRWGFEEKLAYGKGLSLLFYGPPGTGKTMGAQVIANVLNLELYKVDMAGVLSKYVGESEKKLGNIFEQAKKSQSILFFDEADVLFGKRTDQKDSNDKYANASTAYLLQKIEEYEGIIILATNLLQNFDNAFLRRFKFIIEFPFTDAVRRREIWEKVFPDHVPKEELDLDYLAEEMKFSGSQIKNVAVAAAFLAAGEQVPVGMKHILTAVKREMAKTGKTLIPKDFGPYYYLMEEE